MFQAANTLFKHGTNFGAKIKSKQYLLTKLKSTYAVDSPVC